MVSRPIQIGQVFEHWSRRDRVRINNIDRSTVACTLSLATDTGLEVGGIVLSIKDLLRDYYLIAELEP